MAPVEARADDTQVLCRESMKATSTTVARGNTKNNTTQAGDKQDHDD